MTRWTSADAPLQVRSGPGAAPGGLVLALALASGGLLFLGLTRPALVLTKWIFFEEHYSVLSGIVALWEDGDAGLAVLLAVFSVGFPSLKVVLLLTTALRPTGSGRGRWLRLSATASKWSLLDVYVLALVIVVHKTSSILIEAHVGDGAYFFAAAALLSGLTLHVTHRRLRRSTAPPTPPTT